MKTIAMFPFRWSLLGSVLLFLWLLPAAGKPLSPRYTTYDMRVTLDPVSKIIDGHMVLVWKNPSADTLRELQFHMYLNAFKNTKSTFWKESGGKLRGITPGSSDSLMWGWEKILKMETAGGDDLTGGMHYIHPDDRNDQDQTVLSIPLKHPVMPHDSVRLFIDFRSKLPKIFARTGYAGDYFLVAQWFPKPGVYEPAGMRYAEKGQWNCHQFHAHSEFYANFSVYNVTITLPQNYIVGAVGELAGKKHNSDSTTTWNFVANDVVDFTWTASPHFKVVEDQWKDVKIQVFMQPEHLDQAARHTQAVKAALKFFSAHLGPYPYKIVTIVDPPLSGGGSGGMEYPGFFTAGCFWKMSPKVRFTEDVVIHEFGHSYFMGILATNEFEEAWMDEGFNTWFETRIMDSTYGAKTSFVDFPHYHFGDLESQRLRYTTMNDPKIAPVFRTAWGYPEGGYSTMSYSKTTTWMETLRRLVGDETMEEIMKTYYQRWKFKHPCGKDFIAVVNEVVKKEHGKAFGENMNWFFQDVLYGTDVCDYKLAAITNKKVKPREGIFDDNGEMIYVKKKKSKDTLYHSKVVIERLGEVIMPEEILIRFSDSTEVLEKWDGRSRTKAYIFNKPVKVVWARIDPDNKILIDINLQNNSYTTQPPGSVFWKYALKYLSILEKMMFNFSIL